MSVCKAEPPWFTFFLAALYTAIYNYVLKQPNVAELTVEDPAEAFEDLRDRNDLKMLLTHERFMHEAFGDEADGHSLTHHGNGKGKAKARKAMMGPPVEKFWLEKRRVEMKIASVSVWVLGVVI